MNIDLKELSTTDALDVYNMLQEIGPGENGFINDGYGPLSGFGAFLQKHASAAKGIALASNLVPQTMYWLYIDGVPVGYAKLRHYLNDELLKIGGHIGYAIRPSQRSKGYAKLILKEMLAKAKKLGLEEVLMTCMQENTASRRVIEANAGILRDIEEGECHYWIRL
ncbi:MAG: GNAT family N-acetyltransferase [Eubacteriales bacterium]